MKTWKLSLAVAALAGAGLCALVANATEPKPVRPFYNHFTDDDEARLGAAIAAKVEREGVSVSGPGGQAATAQVKRNVILEAYLESIASKLGAASQRPQIPFTVRIIDAPDVVNAMSIPGGHIYIYAGLLRFVQSEDELVAVIAHEIGHVVARHSMNRIARIQTLAGLVTQARQENIIRDDESAQKIADAVVPILFAVDARTPYSRDEEMQADLLGFYEMERAGWSPEGEARLLARLAKGETPESPLGAIVATHPGASARLKAIQQEMRSAKVPGGLKQDSIQFKTMKLGLSIGR